MTGEKRELPDLASQRPEGEWSLGDLKGIFLDLTNEKVSLVFLCYGRAENQDTLAVFLQGSLKSPVSPSLLLDLSWKRSAPLRRLNHFFICFLIGESGGGLRFFSLERQGHTGRFDFHGPTKHSESRSHILGPSDHVRG